VRDYENEYSNIPLRASEKLELNIGYKVYRSPTYVFPEYSGYRERFLWTVADTPSAGAFSMLAQTGIGAAVLGLLVF